MLHKSNFRNTLQFVGIIRKFDLEDDYLVNHSPYARLTQPPPAPPC